MQAENDTIAAIATAPGAAGIAIIRISGSEAFAIADRIFRCKLPVPSQRPAMQIVYGHIVASGKDIDEALLLPFRAPASYTREDIVELHVHGGSISARAALQAIYQAGARPAGPGEFTRRAFLSGRIDLLQAEAVMDLISARSQRAADAAIEQLEGHLSQSFEKIYDALIAVAADLEAQLDFDEDELPARATTELLARLDATRQDLLKLVETWEEGHRLREGTLVVLAGRPNAGKSTLLNLLLGKNRAIVTPIPGTTRDSLEEEVVLQGFPLRIVDTAGLRSADCEIEQEGIRRSRTFMQKAEIVILLLDASRPLDPEDRALLAASTPDKTLVLLNKIDLGQVVHAHDIHAFPVVPCCLLHGEGLDAIKQTLGNMLHLTTQTEAHAVISERHRDMAQQTLQALNQAREILNKQEESCEMMAALALRDGIEPLGQITGRSYHDNLLEAIFSRFCVGK
ncbi:MAG: tRNA uridine-5-carboxymethylaminomethyl(34) synthesis GTPase MnmE [Kiritimatiellia bacterium]